MKHTPGPWEWHEWYGEYGICTPLGIEHPKGMPIARVYYSEADARLIAAAPEMVTLLNAALCEMQNPYAEKWITSGTRMVANNIAALLRRIDGEEETE